MAYALEGQQWPTTSITWSFETSGTSTQGGIAYSNPITDPAEQSLVEQAIADWQANSALTFYQVADQQTPSEAPDIRIGFANLLGQPNDAGNSDTIGITDYYYYPSDNTFASGIYVALQDPSVTPLQPDATGALVYSGTQSSFLQIILHELGHSLGLAHDPTDPDAIMNPVAMSTNRQLDPQDIAGIKALYGDGTGYDTQPTTLYLYGNEDQYTLAENGSGTLTVQGGFTGQEGTSAIATDTTYSFADGTALADPTGQAADVARLYLAVLGRTPDIGGLQAYANAADAGMPLDQIAADLLASPEYAAHASLSNMAFIDASYENVLHRAADPGGLQAYSNALATGTSRAQLVDDLAQSQEGRQDNLALTGDRDDAEVTRLYGAAFDRAPDASGLATFAGLLDAGQSVASVAQDLVGSGEFARLYGGLGNGAFVQALYQTVLHRPADGGGLANWTAQLDAGTSRAAVVTGIADSLENRLDTAAVTHDGYVFVAGG